MQNTPIVHSTSRRTANDAQEVTSQTPQDFLPEINLVATEIPSKSRPYPKKVTISYRPFMLGEVKKISSSVNMSHKAKMDMILEGVKVEGIDKYDLTLNDTLFISLLRKISTLGNKPLSAKYKCGKCLTSGVHTFTLDDLEFKDIAAPEFPIICDLGSLKDLEFSPMTIRSFLKLTDEDKHHDDLHIVAASCTNYDTDLVYKHLYNATIDDAETLDEVDNLMDHGVKPIKFNCKKEGCDNEMSIEVDGEDTIFMPFRRSEKSTSNRIRFGNKA